MQEPCGQTILLGLSGRRLELVGEGTLEESLVASGAAPPRGRAWAVFQGLEPVELSTPLSARAGKELSALLVYELLDWCTAGSTQSHVCHNLFSFVVCGLLHPGDEVACLWSSKRLRLPQRAVRLVGGFADCVHAVTSSGRSFCVSRYGVGVPTSALCCLWATLFQMAEDHGGPSTFARTQRAAFMLCNDGTLLRSCVMVNGGWSFAKLVAGRFLQLVCSYLCTAALRDDGEVLVWSADAESQSGGKATRIWGIQAWTFPGRALQSHEGLFAADDFSIRILQGAEGCSPALEALTTLAQARSGSTALCDPIFGGEGWLFVLACDGTVLVQNCYEWVHRWATAVMQAGLDGALRTRRCKKLARVRDCVLLLLEDGDVVNVKTKAGSRPQRLRGDVDDVLETGGDVALLRLVDGSLVWV